MSKINVLVSFYEKLLSGCPRRTKVPDEQANILFSPIESNKNHV